MIDSADHVTGKTGLTVTATLSKAGGAFGAAGGAVTEVSSGWYKIALNTTDTNTLGDLAVQCTATGADPTSFCDQVSARIMDDAAFPTTSGRSLDVTATGAAGIDWGNVENLTTANALTNTTIATTQQVDVNTIKTNPVVNGGTVTFPTNATLASTTNITAGTITTVTTVTNQLTAAAIATGVWQDATAGDFTTANSIGKALYINNIVPGASGGHFIAGSNAGTTTVGALTVSGATTLTGNVAMAAGLNITQSSSNTSALVVTGNGTGNGAVFTSGSGATGDGVQMTAASTNGDGLQLTKTGTGLALAAPTTDIVLAKTTNITGFNDIAATAIVSGGAITTSGGAVSTVTTTTTATNVTTVNGLAANVITATSINADAITAAKIANGAIDAATFAADVGAEILSYIVDDATRIDASALNTASVTSIPAILDDTGTSGVVVSTMTASALADFFNTDSGTTYGAAVAGSVVKEIADNAGGASLTVQDIVDGVWDESLAAHLGVGSTGEALNAAGAAGDPWVTALPGAYGAGSAGFIVGTNLNATVSSRATQASVDTINGIVDSILVDTAEIGAAGAGLTNINLPNQTMDIVGNITGNLSGSVGSVTGAVGSVTGAVGSVTGNVGGNVTGSVGSVVGLTAANLDAAVSSRAVAGDAMALTAGERNSTADALLGRNVAGGSSAGRLVKEALYVLRNKTDIAAGTLTVYGTDDATPAFTAAVTTTAGNPISQIDPA